MDERATWAERVDGWKASGLTSEQYCEGKPFSPGGLRHWAYRLKRTKARAAPPVTSMTLARVVPIKAREPASAAVAESVASATPQLSAAVVVELGDARVAVRPGFDRGTLAAVFELLREGRGGR